MSKGRGFGSLAKGEFVTDIGSLSVGDVLLEHCEQFGADNTIRVTRTWTDFRKDRVWAQFVDANDTDDVLGAEFCIWRWEMAKGCHWRPQLQPSGRLRRQHELAASQLSLSMRSSMVDEVVCDSTYTPASCLTRMSTTKKVAGQ
jgi:hypothetical protein